MNDITPVLPLFVERLTFSGAYAAEGLLLLILQLLGFVLHLLLVSIITGSVLIAFGQSLRGSGRHGMLASPKSWLHNMPKCLAIGVNLGLVPFLVLQLVIGGYLYAATTLSAHFWFWVPFAVLVAYYLLYICTRPTAKSNAGYTLLLALLSCLFLGVLFVFVNSMSIMQNPLFWMEFGRNATGTLLAFADPAFIPRYLHMVLSCLALAGLTRGYFALRKVKQLEKNQDSAASLFPVTQQARTGLHIFMAATVIQFGIGTWFLLALPTAQQKLFMGGHMGATICFALSCGFSLLAIGFAKIRKATLVWLCMFPVLGMMVYMRFVLRTSFLQSVELAQPHPDLLRDPIYSTTPPEGLIFFLCCTVITLAAIAYMIRVYYQRKPVPSIPDAPNYWEGPELAMADVPLDGEVDPALLQASATFADTNSLQEREPFVELEAPADVAIPECGMAAHVESSTERDTAVNQGVSAELGTSAECGTSVELGAPIKLVTAEECEKTTTDLGFSAEVEGAITSAEPVASAVPAADAVRHTESETKTEKIDDASTKEGNA